MRARSAGSGPQCQETPVEQCGWGYIHGHRWAVRCEARRVWQPDGQPGAALGTRGAICTQVLCNDSKERRMHGGNLPTCVTTGAAPGPARPRPQAPCPRPQAPATPPTWRRLNRRVARAADLRRSASMQIWTYKICGGGRGRCAFLRATRRTVYGMRGSGACP